MVALINRMSDFGPQKTQGRCRSSVQYQFSEYSTVRSSMVGYILSDQGLPISLKDARECLHRATAEGIREGKGEAACTVLYSCISYVISQQGRVSEVRHRQSLARRGDGGTGGGDTVMPRDEFDLFLQGYGIVSTTRSQDSHKHCRTSESSLYYRGENPVEPIRSAL
jgi:hypothetical protein